MAEPRDPAPPPAERQGGLRTPEEPSPEAAPEEDPRVHRGERVESGVEQVDKPGRSAEEP
jgi:hypothetical protein